MPAFIINRALRVFPPFWFAVALALVVAVSFPATQGGTYVISIPKSASDWSANTLIWGLYGPPKKVLPPTWSLHTELVFYVVIGLLTAVNFWATLAGFVVSMVICALYFVGAADIMFYGNPIGNAFAFFAGSLTYYLRQRLEVPVTVLVAALGAYAICMFVVPHRVPASDANLALSLLPLSIIMANAWSRQADAIITGRSVNVCQFLGLCAYPLFLMHWIVGALVLELVFAGNRPPDPIMLLTAGPLSIVAAGIMAWGVDRPLEIVRSAVRRST